MTGAIRARCDQSADQHEILSLAKTRAARLLIIIANASRQTVALDRRDVLGERLDEQDTVEPMRDAHERPLRAHT